NHHLSKIHLMSDTKSTSTTCFSPTLSPASSSSSLSASSKSALTTKITSEKPNRPAKNETAFYSPNPSSSSKTHSVSSSSNGDNSQLDNIFQSSSSSLERSMSYPPDSNVAYNFTEIENTNIKYNFTNNNETSLQLDVKSSNPTDLSTTKSETMDTSLRTSDGLYKCRICKRIFANRYSLTGHYKSHYEPSQKPYCCDDCGQRYTSPSNLHYHRGRNCPVLKLKAIREGKLIPSSVQNTKLLELKALRAVERKALMNRLKDESDTTSTEINSSVDKSKSQQPPVNKKSRLATCKVNNDVKNDYETTMKTTSSIENSRENIMSKSTNFTFDPVSPISSINNNVNNNNNNNNNSNNVSDISNIFQENGNSLQIQEIVRLFLMHAYQSDELRQQLLSLTSNALLNTLLPTSGFNPSLFSNQVPTSNQQLFSLLSNFINSNLSTERNFNNNHHDNSSISYKQSKSLMEKSTMQSDSIALSTEQPTDLTSSCNFSHYNDKSSSPGIHSPICQDSLKFPDIQELDKHISSVHEKYSRFLTETTKATANSVQPLVRRYSLNETIPSKTDWNMKSANSMPTTPHTMMQHYHHQQQPINYSEDLSVNNHKLSNTTEQSLISQLNLQSSNLVSCTDCDREFSTYTAFRVHHTKTHQHTANRQHHHQHSQNNQRHSHSQRILPKSQLINHQLSTLSIDQNDISLTNDNDSEY
ncbi:GDNF-inducible zinc finger 1, partial [Schistosoma japonicum]